MERQNDMEELSVNISYCPYCGSKNIIRINDVDCTCNDCGRDYMVITCLLYTSPSPRDCS